MTKCTRERMLETMRTYAAAVEEEVGRADYYARRGEYELTMRERLAMEKFLEAAREVSVLPDI